MKLLYKIAIILLIGAPVTTSAGIYAAKEIKKQKALNPTDISSDDDYYTMDNGDYTLKLDRYNLSFEITKNSKTWSSGKVDPSDNKITSLREAFLQSPATIYFNGGESYFSIFDSNHRETTTIRFSASGDTLKARIGVLDGRRTSPNLSMNFTINYQLVDDGLIISVSDISENEEGKNKFSKLAIYPGFGMSYLQNDGYFLIPDGSGALIDLSTPSHARSPLQLRTYGKDMGVATDTRTIYSGEQLSMPMYAIADNEKTLMSTIEGGQEFSELNSKVAGMSDSYNASWWTFHFKEMTYQYMGISESSRKPVLQENMNEFTPIIHYHLYDEAMEYYDIAAKYQEYLLNNQLLNNDRYGNAKLRLEFLMSENKKALFGNEVFKMTSANFIENKMKELNELGNDFTVSLKGYSEGGYTNSYPNTFPIEGRTGSSGDYKELGKYLKDNDMSLNFNVDLLRSFSGNSNKLAMNMSQKLISSNDYVNGTNVKFYRQTPNSAVNLLNKYEANVDKYNASGFDFTSIGSDLYSTYYHEKNSRTDSINKLTNAIKEFNYQKNMRKPNLYMYPYFNNYLDTPTSSSAYMIETSSVPFLQMVLSGYKSFYSTPINLNYLGEKQLLELIDYNTSPSYLLTEEDTMKLIDSPASSYIYSSVYDVWENDIKNSYDKVISVLKQVEGQRFISRIELSPKVYKNTYENGKVIIINYSSNPYSYSLKEVLPLSYEVFSE